jgi:hypothetical protein
LRIQYLEIVTGGIDAVCAAYAAANGVRFGAPDAGLGDARTARLSGGGLLGAAGAHARDQGAGGAAVLARG